MLHLLKKFWERKVIRFLVVGCFNTAFDISLLLAILKVFNWPPLVANSLSVSIAITVSYFLNHRIVFRHYGGYSLKKYARFFLVTGLGVILIQDIVIYFVTDKFWVISKMRTFVLLGHATSVRTIELLGAKLTAVLVGLTWNYLLYKYVVFRGHETAESKEEELVVG
jgi:putative flippase GtrA